MSTELTDDSATAAQPVAISETSIAALGAHMIPSFVLTTFISRFNTIVEDPVSSLTTLLLQLGIAQAVYLVLCLPPVTKSSTTPTTKTTSKNKKVAGPAAAASKPATITLSSKITTAILSLVLALLAGTPIIAGVMVLFGAPLTTHLSETILCAAHIALLSVPPLVYTHGVDSEKWRRIGALMAPLDAIHGASLGTLVGAWIGAIPIPLDWDRDWQRWPCTIIAGAYAGWALGGFAGRYILKGKKVDLSA